MNALTLVPLLLSPAARAGCATRGPVWVSSRRARGRCNFFAVTAVLFAAITGSSVRGQNATTTVAAGTFPTAVAVPASLTSAAGHASQATNSAAAKKAQLAQAYGKLPLSFEANQGQADKNIRFLSSGGGYSLSLTDSSAVLTLTKPGASNARTGPAIGNGPRPAFMEGAGKTDIIRMDLAGANRAIRVTGMDPLPGTANYFIGNDPAKWLSGVPTYAKVEYSSVYPGIDLVYYGSQRQLESGFNSQERRRWS